MDRICHIVGGGEFHPEHFRILDGDFIIAADAGFEYMNALGIAPDMTVGDFDTLGFVPNVNKKVVLPVAKDDTDTGFAAKWAYDQGFRAFELHGCTGGRVDHTLANLQTIANLARLGCSVVMHDKNVNYYAISNSTLGFDESACGTISIFAHGDTAVVSIKGLKYEIENTVLDPFFPLGVSNSFQNQKSSVTVHDGVALIVAPSDANADILL